MRIQIRRHSEGFYHRTVKVTWGDQRFKFSWRWYPLFMWRYFPRAWQGYPPAGVIMATDWTGRDRELMAIAWHVEWMRWTVITNPDPSNMGFAA